MAGKGSSSSAVVASPRTNFKSLKFGTFLVGLRAARPGTAGLNFGTSGPGPGPLSATARYSAAAWRSQWICLASTVTVEARTAGPAGRPARSVFKLYHSHASVLLVTSFLLRTQRTPSTSESSSS
eukprot:385963-Hanusia_phi.AAC.1